MHIGTKPNPFLSPIGGWLGHRGQLSRLSGPTEGNTDWVNPMGHDWSLDSVAIGLMTGRLSFSPLWPSDRHVDKTCKEGQQLSVAFSPTFLIWTLMSPWGNRGCRRNSSWQDTFSYMLDYWKSIMHDVFWNDTGKWLAWWNKEWSSPAHSSDKRYLHCCPLGRLCHERIRNG